MNTAELFTQGWLTRHLHQLNTHLNTLPTNQQPHLTGHRATIMTSPNWLTNPDGPNTPPGPPTRR